MRITRVELKNIKNHSDATFEFGSGVIAICGPNGAGKTTILEAIAWALFDHLSYTRENFLKRGEKRGYVRVSFISQDDGREYEVFRDTTGAYHVYDTRLKIRIVEQKTQVSKWLRQHLGVEPGTDLAALFRTSIGVPQGTFTMDFADTPSKRKPTFDKILKVEEYQRSAELMKEISRLIEKKLADIRERIAGAEGELKRYDEVLLEKNNLDSQQVDLQAQLTEASEARDRIQNELSEQDELRSRLEQLRNEVERLSFEFQQEERHRANAAAEFARAQTAAETVERTAAGHQLYLESRERLSALSVERAERDQLRSQLSKIETAIVRSQSAIESITRHLTEIDVARKEAAELKPKILRQEKLESDKANLQQKAGQRQTLEVSVAGFENELKDLRKRYTEASKKVEEVEILASSSERVKHLEQQIAITEAELSSKEMSLKSLADKQVEADRVRATISRIGEEISSVESKLSVIGEKAAHAALAGALQVSFDNLTNETATVSAEIKKDREMLAQVKNGLCPLLAQRCLNMKDGQTLDQYFGIQLAENEARLLSLQDSKRAIERDLKVAREAAAAAAQQATLKAQLENRHEEMILQQEHLEEIDKSIREAGEISDSSVNEQRQALQSIKDDLSKARADQSKYERLGLLQQNLERIKQDGKHRREVHDKQRTQLAELSAALNKLKQVEAELTSLGDPRGRARQLNSAIAKQSTLLKEQSEATEAAAKLNEELAGIKQRLVGFEQVDSEWEKTIAVQAANERDYQDFLANKSVAETIESRRIELNQILESVANLETLLAESKKQLESLEPSYNKDRHDSLLDTAELIRGRLAKLEAESDGVARRLIALQAELDQLDIVRARVSEHLQRRSKLEELGDLSDFIRDCLKKAGPHITEAYLYTISIRANQLFRDISGNALVNLKWDKDYEILLEEAGRERPFANLSGGEQMAAALAVRLALLKELSDLRIAFFDEPTTNMDEERRRNLAQQIGHVTDFDQLFVITHDDSFEGYTDEVINIGKPSTEPVQRALDI